MKNHLLTLLFFLSILPFSEIQALNLPASSLILLDSCNKVRIVNDTAICEGESVVLCAISGSASVPPLTYLWSTGATTSCITVAPTSTTVYSVTVTDSNGCTGSDNGTVTVSCTPPEILSVTAIGSTYVQVCWADSICGDSFQVRYRYWIPALNDWSSATLTNHITTGCTYLTGLNCGTLYEWKVRRKCASGYSSFSEVVTFTTSPCFNSPDERNMEGGQKIDFIDLEISPNPVIDLATVVFPEALVGAKILLYTMHGTRVKEWSVLEKTSTAVLDLTDFPAGNYVIFFNNGYAMSQKMITKL